MHANLRIIVDKRSQHPYGVKHRLTFFADKAGRGLVASRHCDHDKHYVIYNVVLRTHEAKRGNIP